MDSASIQQQYELDIYKIKHDIACYVQHLDKVQKDKRAEQLAKACHVKVEYQRGTNRVVDFIATNCKHETGLYEDSGALESIKKARLLYPSDSFLQPCKNPTAAIFKTLSLQSKTQDIINTLGKP